MTKVLFISPDSSFTRQVKKAFEQNGAQVTYIDDRVNYTMPGLLSRNKLLWRLTRKVQFLRTRSNARFARRVLDTVEQMKPDILFVNKSLLVKPPLLAELKSRGIKTANWFPENTNNEPYRSWLLKDAPAYDYFLSFDSAVLEQFPKDAKTKVHYVPFAVDPQAAAASLTNDDRRKYSANIVFVGAPYSERVEALESVKDLGLKIFGWNGWKDTSLASYWYGSLNAVESAKAYVCAKICINTNLEPPTNGVNVKTFEIPAAGGFQLSDYRKDVEGLFQAGKEIAIFKNHDELRSKVQYYLEHGDERKAIARAGHERLLRDHTMNKRVSEILKILQ